MKLNVWVLWKQTYMSQFGCKQKKVGTVTCLCLCTAQPLYLELLPEKVQPPASALGLPQTPLWPSAENRLLSLFICQ